MNVLIGHVRALGERTAAEFNERWRALKSASAPAALATSPAPLSSSTTI
ncbi:hypothetical protein [Streptosporangium subroseum]|nr:hypothetical protein [Streptosporangium subroseum]